MIVPVESAPHPITPETVVRDLSALGISAGDTLLVRAAARSIGFAADHARQLLSALLATLARDGTLLAYAHTGDQYVWRRDASRFFTADSPNITGGLAAAMLAHPRAFRSRHPTNSWAPKLRLCFPTTMKMRFASRRSPASLSSAARTPLSATSIRARV